MVGSNVQKQIEKGTKIGVRRQEKDYLDRTGQYKWLYMSRDLNEFKRCSQSLGECSKAMKQ